MDRQTLNRFKALLLDLPFWNRERERAVFITDALWEQGIDGTSMAQGDPQTVAAALLNLCAGYDTHTEGGIRPLCDLLNEIRERGLADNERRKTVDALAQALGCDSRKPTWPHAPYPGLLALDQWQAPIFFGRRRETRELLRRLTTEQGQRFLLLTGASGSGKSSLVRAGICGALAKGNAPNLRGSGSWLMTAMSPSEQGGDPFCALTSSLKQNSPIGLLAPAEEAARLKSDRAAFADLLSRALANLPVDAEWLLVLDQMEELFTPSCETLRGPFLDLVLSASELPRFRVIATVRSDFLDRCLDHPGLLEVLNNGGQYGLRAPGPLAMIRMISGPARELNLADPVTLDPALVSRMVDDAMTEPAGLALLAFALRDLYDRCKATGKMNLDAYLAEGFGGLKAIVQRCAKRALERAGAEGRAALPRVFSRLLWAHPGGASTRRRAGKDHWAGDAGALAIIAQLSRQDTRLLVVGPEDNPAVEIAHAALLREWTTLAQWIQYRREALWLRDKIVEESRIWVRSGRPDAHRWKHELIDPTRRTLAQADLLEEMESEPDTAEFLTPESERLLTELVHSGTDDIRREAIGIRLSEIGDPRPGVGVIEGVPDILWCDIPEGEVEIGGHGRYQVAPFRLAAYLVTYAQYRAFLDAGDGHESDNWWKGLRREVPPPRQLRPYASYPADQVSWYDATAYCRWLTGRLGFEVRLPDEWEWQWAAQSACPDFAFPWGQEWHDGLANTSESRVGRTTAVGMYPAGRSLQGVDDLAGNVWEWCRNKEDDPREIEPGGDESRVLRGGSFNYDRDGARADDHPHFHPGRRLDDFGFRLVCACSVR